MADLLRGDFKQSEYGRVILPFTVLRRLDCVLAPTRAAALAEYRAKSAAKLPFVEFVRRAAGQSFFNLFPRTCRDYWVTPTICAITCKPMCGPFPRTCKTSSPASIFPPPSSGCTRRGCCISSPRNSPASTCIPTPSAITRWACCSRNSCGVSRRCPTKRPESTLRRGKSFT
ncbi:type I restriction-modification system subunit M N-terminal domain-containing protein [Acidithiobacillus ferridurans]|uniref:type I restriction-modification system subunit M N-terminal domain-containing protein n=1 Tax=Acidithiobacillus ferridurans TaxID=1232575 RepID=UPI002F2600BE